jgi:transposase InsO family protein
MVRRLPAGSGQTWRTFLRNHASRIAAIGFLVVPTVTFRLLSVLVILRHERRRLILLSVTDHPTAEWIAQQITEAFPWNEAPSYLIRDRDARYGHAVRRRAMAMGIRDHPIAARSPWQNGHVERLIGSIRRECLDHMVILSKGHLRRILKVYGAYYNHVRPHLALAKDAPLASCSAVWQDHGEAYPRRTSSPILPDLIFGRDSLDHIVILGEGHLRPVLKAYAFLPLTHWNDLTSSSAPVCLEFEVGGL